MELSPAQRRVLEALRAGPRQAHDLAKDIGVDPSSTYRQVVRLKAQGLVDARDVIDGPGRPKRMYHLTESGQETFPRDYAFLLKALLQEIETKGGREAIIAHLTGIAERLGGPLAEEPDFDKRMQELIAIYNRLGFEARLERKGNDLVLIQRNCPFLKTARGDPRALCTCLDEGIMRAALPDVEVELLETLAHGDDRCGHLIRTDKRPRVDPPKRRMTLLGRHKERKKTL